MPAGRGAESNAARGEGRRSPPRRREPPKPTVNLRSSALPTQPFRPAQRQAQRKVVQAQRRLPQEPTPRIPRLAHPTPSQTAAALSIVHQHQRASGKKPDVYWREVRNDPRQRAYIQTVAHYVAAANRHAPAASAPGRREVASRASAPHGLLSSLPIPATVRNYLGERVAEDVPKLAAAGSGIVKLLTQPTPTGKGVLGNALADVSNIGRVPLIGLYQFAGAGLGAAQGNLKPAKQLASGIAQGVEKGAVGQLAQGNLQGAVRALGEHPILSPLEVAGAAGVAGRTAGAVARAADLGGVDTAFGRAVGRVRSPIALGQDAGHIKRGHVEDRGPGSPDLFRGLAQQALDRQRGYFLDEKGRPITRAKGGRKVAVVKPREGRILNERERLENRRGNFYSAGLASRQRQLREKVPHELAKALPKVKGRLARSLILPASTATIKTVRSFEDDLRKRIKLIEGKVERGAYRHEADQAAAEANLKTFKAALADPRVLAQKAEIVKAGETLAKIARVSDAELERLGVYPAARLERGRLSEYALAHYPGAKHGNIIEPEALALHEASVAAHGEAKAAVAAAETALRKAEDQRTGHVALGRSARMRGGQPGARPATAAEKRALASHDEAVSTAKQRLKEADEHAQEAGEHLLPKPKPEPHIRDAQGDYLSNEAIREHAKAAGRHPDTIAYMPHRLDERISRAYYKQLKDENRPTGGAHERTGHLYEGGSTAISLDAAREELVNKATTIAAVQAYDRLAGDIGLRSPHYQELARRAQAGDGTLTKAEREVVKSGGHMKWNESHDLVDKLSREGKGDYLVMRAYGAALDRSATDRVQRLQGTAEMESAHQAMFQSRLEDNGSGANNTVIVPKTVIDRIKAQNQAAGDLQRWGRLLNVAFRYTVLPQFKWLAGNFIEPYFIRLPLSGSGINLPGLAMDLYAAHKVLKHMEASPNRALKEAAAHIRAQQLDSGLFIGGKAGSVHTSRTDMGGAMGRLMQSAAKWGGKGPEGFPVLHQLGQLAIALPKFFFYFNRHVIENPAQRAAFGKSVRRELQAHNTQWIKTVKLGQRAVEEASRGLVDTATQHRFLKEQHELLGQYDTFGPSTRHIIQTFTPFLPWTLASLRFVYWTLPIHHTVAFNALMKAGQNVLPEWEAEHQGTPPGDLRWSPKSRGGFVDVPRLTPFGISVPLSEEGAGVLTETFAPQAKGAQEALKGNDPFGRALALPHGEKPTAKQRNLLALNNLLEGLVPGVATARRLQEGGGTSDPRSTIFSPKAKPGTSHVSALERTLSPLRPIFLKAPTGGASTPAQRHLEQEADKAAESHSGSPLMRHLEEEADRRAAKR